MAIHHSDFTDYISRDWTATSGFDFLAVTNTSILVIASVAWRSISTLITALSISDLHLEGLDCHVGYPPRSDQISTINIRSFLENVAFLFSHLRFEKPVIVSMAW